MFGLGLLFYLSVLLLNSVAILNEERFLKRLMGDDRPSFGAPADTFQGRLINLVHAVRTVMRPPLIAFNLLIIGYELILG